MFKTWRAGREVHTLRRENSDLSDKHACYFGQLEKCRKAEEDLRGSVLSLTEQQQNLLQCNANLKERLAREEAKRQEWEEQIKSQKGRDISEANAKVKSLEETLASERDHSAKLTEELQMKKVEFENRKNKCTQKLEKQKRLHQDLTIQLKKKASSLQAALLVAEEHKSVQSSLQKQLQDERELNEKIQEEAKKEKEKLEKDFHELKNSYEHNTRLLLEEQSKNEELKEDRKKTKTYVKKITKKLDLNLKLLETERHKYKELLENLKSKDENTELVDQLTKQVTSLRAELQATEDGFKKEKDVIQRDLQELKDSYEHNAQLLLEEQSKNEVLREEGQKPKIYEESLHFNLQLLETERHKNKDLLEKLKRKDENTELADQLTKQVMSLQAELQVAEDGFKKEQEVTQRDLQELKDSYEHNAQLLLEEQQKNVALKEERKKTKTYLKKITKKLDLNQELLETERHKNKELLEKLKSKDENTELADQLTKQVTSLQAELQEAEECYKEKEVTWRDLQELKDSYEHNTQLLLEEQSKNVALKEERRKTKTYIEDLHFNLQLLETERHKNKELLEKLKGKDENTELVDQLTKQVMSLQAELQAAEEGFKKEKDMIQRDLKELKDSYEHNAQLLFEEQSKNEVLKEEGQKTKIYEESFQFNLQLLETERHNNKELLEKLKRKDENTELADQLTKQVTSLQAELQAAEEGFKKEKDVTQRDLQYLKDNYEHNAQLLLEEQSKNEVLREEKQKTKTYVKKITKKLDLNQELLETERNKNKQLLEKLKRKDENTELVDQLTKQVTSLQAEQQAAEEGYKKEKDVVQRDLQELKDSYEHNAQLLLEEQSKNEALKEERQKTKTYIEDLHFNLQLLETERHKNKELLEKLKGKDENTELADQLTKQVTSLQAELQAAEKGFKKEKDMIQRDLQQLKDSYEHNAQLLLEEQSKNEVLKEEGQKTKIYEESFQFNLQLLETERHNNKELTEKLKTKDENTELADQLTELVKSLQAELQAAEEGFKQEKDVLQRDLQDLKDSYGHNTQLLLEEQSKNEAMREERQKTKTYIEDLHFNLQLLETERHKNKELLEKLKRKDENTELADQLNKQVTSLQAELQAAEEGFKKEKEVIERDLQELKDSYEYNTQRLLEIQSENEMLKEERQKTYVNKITKNLHFNLQHLELERRNNDNKELMAKHKLMDENTELADELAKQVTSLQAELQAAEESFKMEKDVLHSDLQELKDSYEHNAQLLLEEKSKNEVLREEGKKAKIYEESFHFNLQLLETDRHKNKELTEKLKRKKGNMELADELAIQVTSLQAELQAAEEGFKMEKEVLHSDLQELKDSYEHNAQLLLEEQSKNEALREEGQKTKSYMKKITEKLDLNQELLETDRHKNKELTENLKRKEENMELVNQLTKQVTSLQAELQAAEEGFKKEKDMLQRDLQELKDSYEYNTQRLLGVQRENEVLKEDRQKTNADRITKNLHFNLQHLELERRNNNKELMEKLKLMDENTELADELAKQVTSLQAELQTAEEGFKMEKEVLHSDIQKLKDSYVHNTQLLLEEQRKNEALRKERGKKTDKYKIPHKPFFH